MKTYDISKGHLILEHDYPRDSSGKRETTKCHSVSVDVNSILGSLNSDDLCVGAWLNVVGYTRPRLPGYHQHGQRWRDLVSDNADSVCVDAIMVFSAGSIEIFEYERILKNLLVLSDNGL